MPNHYKFTRHLIFIYDTQKYFLKGWFHYSVHVHDSTVYETIQSEVIIFARNVSLKLRVQLRKPAIEMIFLIRNSFRMHRLLAYEPIGCEQITVA